MLNPFDDSLDNSDKFADDFFKNIFLFNIVVPYLNKNVLFSKKLVSHMPNFEDFEKRPFNGFNNRLKKTNLELKKNEINSLNFRSDDFIKTHEGLHILFSGCSNTWGTGLKKEEVWSYKLYNKILKEKPCSGYFNLAIPGTSTASQIINLFKYFKEYGNPDIIFINFPDLLRFYGYSDKAKIFFDSFYKEQSKEILELINFQYYFMLDQYCKSNNIKLYSFSWIESEQKTPISHKIFELPFYSFSSYYKINKQDVKDYIKKYKEDNPNESFIDFARDDEHPGIAHQDYWSNFIYNKYKNQDSDLE